MKVRIPLLVWLPTMFVAVVVARGKKEFQPLVVVSMMCWIPTTRETSPERDFGFVSVIMSEDACGVRHRSMCLGQVEADGIKRPVVVVVMLLGVL